jgi:thiamine kinase-like enzyme
VIKPLYYLSRISKQEAARCLERFFAKAGDRRKEEQYLLNEPWLRVINTEVNSHNFIVNSEQQRCFLIDWEKPIWGEPAQDLAHFLIATTTLWKRNYLLSREEEDLFLRTYLQALPPVFQAKTLPERVEMFKFFIYLRAVSWCAMAFTEYIKPGRPLSNQDTFEKIKQFLEPDFLDRIMG